MRLSNEDGRSAGARNFGRLALFTIPLTLGMAASIWLGVWIQAHYFLIDRDQELRHGSFVAAPDPQRAELKVTTYTGGSSIAIDNVDIQGGRMTVKFHNFSGHTVTGLQVHWEWIAPDGTKLSDHYDWCHTVGGPSELDSRTKGIVTDPNVTPDPRAAGVGVWVIGNN